jgi:hypothetical protein
MRREVLARLAMKEPHSGHVLPRVLPHEGFDSRNQHHLFRFPKWLIMEPVLSPLATLPRGAKVVFPELIIRFIAQVSDLADARYPPPATFTVECLTETLVYGHAAKLVRLPPETSSPTHLKAKAKPSVSRC